MDGNCGSASHGVSLDPRTPRHACPMLPSRRLARVQGRRRQHFAESSRTLGHARWLSRSLSTGAPIQSLPIHEFLFPSPSSSGSQGTLEALLPRHNAMLGRHRYSAAQGGGEETPYDGAAAEVEDGDAHRCRRCRCCRPSHCCRRSRSLLLDVHGGAAPNAATGHHQSPPRGTARPQLLPVHF